MKKLSFAFDCDGVLQDYAETLDRLMHAEYGHHPVNAYSMYDRFPNLTKKQVNKIWDMVSTHNLLVHLKEIDNAFSILKELQGYGHDVYVVTAIQDHLYDDRLASFHKHGFNPTKLFCVGNVPKTTAYLEASADYMFDDQLFHLVEADGHVEHKILINNGIPQKKNAFLSDYRKYSTVAEWFAAEKNDIL